MAEDFTVEGEQRCWFARTLSDMFAVFSYFLRLFGVTRTKLLISFMTFTFFLHLFQLHTELFPFILPFIHGTESVLLRYAPFRGELQCVHDNLSSSQCNSLDSTDPKVNADYSKFDFKTISRYNGALELRFPDGGVSNVDRTTNRNMRRNRGGFSKPNGTKARLRLAWAPDTATIHPAVSLQSRYSMRKISIGHNISQRSEPEIVRTTFYSLGRSVDQSVSATKSLSFLDSNRPIRMERKRVVLVDRPEPFPAHPNSLHTQSIPDRSYYIEDGNDNDTSEERFPVLSFQYVEPHTIELLVVVTERMRQRFGALLNDYLTSTMTTVSSLLRHPSLKTSIKLDIVDIILLDPVYAKRHNLEDWSFSKQEQVMAKFCRWVNRLRRPTFNWDSTILLNVGHFKSTALGVAHYRSMCSEESACLAVLDRGFGTGYIIAHELGHQLGAKHDFELNSDCGMEEQPLVRDVMKHTGGYLGTIHGGTSIDDFDQSQRYWHPIPVDEAVRRDTIMSGTLYFDNFPLRWSACSRKAINDFLESHVASCLRHEQTQEPLHSSQLLAKRSQHDLPGAIFSLDQQCQFVLKVPSTRFCGHMLPVCRQLYCEENDNGACLPMEAAWAEGSECGENQWCIQGQCVPNSQKPVRIDGHWGPWGPWSSCSRECGGGVRFSERECTNPIPQQGGDYCHGTRTRMRSCAVQPCEKRNDIRQQLCDQVGLQYGTQLDAYIPKLGEASACSLTCLKSGHAIHHELTIPDGTPCYSQRDDICIKSRCWETGCDGVLGSSQRFDRCRVCGGDNNTCVEISGVFNEESVSSFGVHPRGLITAVRIPRGVTNAFVRKNSSRKTPFSSDSYDDFMLLIFEELKTQIRRGETREPFAGAELYYSGSRKSEEVVSITGRLQKDVNIVIRVENSHTTRPLPKIEYHYYVPNDQRHNPLYFIAEEEARATAHRSNKRSGRSHRPSGSTKVALMPSSGKGDGAAQSDRVEQHKRPRVHFVWRISDLPTGCSTCTGNGTSYAACYPLLDEIDAAHIFSSYDFNRPVADHLCSTIPRPPFIIRQCADYCGVRWSVKPASSVSTDRSACSVRCGDGVQPVVHVCEEFIVPAEQKDKTKGHWRPAQLGERACLKAGLGNSPTEPATASCQGMCQPVFLVASNWTECSETCAFGERRRKLLCQELSGFRWRLRECYTNTTSVPQGLTPPGSVMNEEASEILSSQTDKEHMLSQITFMQSEPCLSLSGCRQEIKWASSQWSECELLNDEMKILCRSIDYNDAYKKPAIQLIGMRTRQVFCHFLRTEVHSSLLSYMENSSGPPWSMKPDFCRRVEVKAEVPEEPVNRESCERPYCYRWGEAKSGQCSTPCGPGTKTVSIPCEKVTLDLLSMSADQKYQSAPTYWIEPAPIDECHSRLGYSPRIFLSADNQTVRVETIERPLHEPGARELKATGPDQSIQLNCRNAPCTMSIPVWHTTAWENCSVKCGQGVRKRSVLCVLETHVQSLVQRLHGYPVGIQDPEPSVVTTGRLNAELTDPEKCRGAGLPKPNEEEPCNDGPCPKWLPDAWGECTGVCEYGIQTRHVRCVVEMIGSQTASAKVAVDDDLSHAVLFSTGQTRHHIRKHRSVRMMEVDAAQCRNAGDIPVTKRVCLISRGCPYWFKGDWTACSVECGMGQRVRTVACRFPNGTLLYGKPNRREQQSIGRYSDVYDRSLESMTRIVEDERVKQPTCPSVRPVDQINCKPRPCSGKEPFWWPVMVAQCDSQTCEVGKRNRVIACLSSSRGPIHEDSCRHLPRPTDHIPCVPLNCVHFEWSTDQWSACPRGCGVRTRYRRIRCVDSFGEEYSDALCPQHLRPDSWRLCPNPCTITARSCADVQKYTLNSNDGTFQIMIGLIRTSIYCADMKTENPKEYISLRRVNFARTTGLLQPSPTSQWCPPIAGVEWSTPSYLTGNQIEQIDLTNQTESDLIFQSEVTASNCPSCLHLPNLASVTYYDKIRLELSSLRIDVEDTRFAYTVGQSSVPFGTAKDCFATSKCPQGRFRIDLRGTGFRVSVKTQWVTTKSDATAHIFRSERGQLLSGMCGGYCSGCWPQPDLLLELVDDSVR